MAYVNVRDWSVEQVTEWLKGLDSVIAPYTQSFLNNEVKGNQLLSLRSDDLEHLGVYIIGHQEIILEAVEHLRNFHYKLDKENLQMLSLSLSCAANSLGKELSLTDENCTMVPTQTMSDVHNIITAIKQLVCWLDRSPFRGDKDYVDYKTQLLQLSFEMATSAHRDIFSEKPLRSIRNISNILTGLADHIIQEVTDPMILQPASLALATLKKKKEQELGFFLVPSNYAVHQIAEIKYGSPAHNSSKIEDGDEIVQVNYQTVVGWQRKSVLFLLQESPPEIVLTLKKRPRHTKVYGQIYMKPYRLPSKKQATPYSRWNDNLPSPQLLAIYDLPQIPRPRLPAVPMQPETETEISSSSDSEPLDSLLEKTGRVYPIKPRPVLQRRNTVTGASPINRKPHQAIEQYWQQLKATYKHSSSYNIEGDNYKEESTLLRDKSVSCNDGFQLSIRPSTVIGLSPNTSFKQIDNLRNSNKKKVNFEAEPQIKSSSDAINLNASITSLSSFNENLDFIDEGDDIMDRSNMKINWQMDIIDEIINSINYDSPSQSSKILAKHSPQKDAALADVKVHNIIKKFDSSAEVKPLVRPRVFPKNVVEKPPELPIKSNFAKKPIVPPKNIKFGVVRGTLNKSNSAPAYDPTAEKPEEHFKANEVDNMEMIKGETEPVKKLNVKFDDTPIKYELGIPIVENSAPSSIILFNPLTLINLSDTSLRQEDVSSSPSRCSISSLDANKLGDSAVFSCSHSSESIIFEESSLEKSLIVKGSNSIDNLSSLSFEGRNVSTPVSKYSKFEADSDLPISKTNVKVVADNKISPTNSIVRAMMYSSKTKDKKKKINLVTKRRKVGVKDVIPGEMQGYLHQRSRLKHIQRVNWVKRWFVLNGSYLYGFESKDSVKAKCLIFLSGFTVSVADEVKSRCNAFKVYHTGTVFYFSAENSETLLSWIELITAATLSYSETKNIDSLLYSESDDDFDSDRNKLAQTDEVKQFGSLKKASPDKNESAQSGSSSLDRKWFFNKANKNTLPVPTAQFRSYRKIPSSVSTGNFTSHIPDFSPSCDSPQSQSQISTSVVKVKKSLNYAHASNPNLCEIGDFQARPFNKPFQQCSENLVGFVTLEELMIRQTEDQKLNPYSVHDTTPINLDSICPDVVYGQVPVRLQEFKPEMNKPPQTEEGSFCFGKRSSLKKQKKQRDYETNTYPKINLGDEPISSRSLPRTQKLNDVEKSKRRFFAKKEYSVSYVDLKDHSCAQVADDTKHEKSAKIVRQRSLTSSDKKDSLSKFWIDSWKRTDKVADKGILKLKSADQYTPMSLPLVPDHKGKLNPKFAFELNLDEKTSRSGKIINFFSKQSEKKEKLALDFQHLSTTQYESRRTSENCYSEDLCHSYSQPVSALHTAQTIDYPGLEYPPVFEPETYSLSDPQSNISILRKQDKSN